MDVFGGTGISPPIFMSPTEVWDEGYVYGYVMLEFSSTDCLNVSGNSGSFMTF